MATRFKSRKAKVRGKIATKTLPDNFFSAFGKEAQIRANNTTRALAQDISKKAKEIIRKQEYDWEPLSEAYLEYKERKGLDERTLIATKDYVNNGIGWWEKDGYIFVGPKEGIHKPSGVPYKLLAKWFEYGTWKMHARPLWRPLASVALRESQKLKTLYVAAVKKALAKKIKSSTKTKKGKV